MNLKGNVDIHNTFIVEVRNKYTGELKQQGIAKNIMLNRMFERLCNLSSYFSYIHFGTGTGVLDPSRTTLFNKLGYKSAETEEIIKSYPVSKYTRKITLNPEEYVGETITEVGISDSSSYINTHALIKDSEGNPLSLTKTDIDVVVIYATVFIQLSNKSDNFVYIGLPNNNSLLNYLTGGSTPSKYFEVAKDWVKGLTLVSENKVSKSTTTTADIANKKVIFNTSRYGITEANMPISKIMVQNMFACILPETGIFESHDLTNQLLGVGDGATKVFKIPHPKPNNLIVTADDVLVTNYTTRDILNQNFKLQDLTGTGSTGRKISFSSDGNYLACVSKELPHFTVFKKNEEGNFNKLQALTDTGNSGYGVSFSPDGNYLACASWELPYFTVFKKNIEGTFDKLQDLTNTGNNGQGVSFSQDGNYIACASPNSPHFTVFKKNEEGTFDKLQELTGAGSYGYVASFSPDGNYLACASWVSLYFTVFKKNEEGIFDKIQDLTGAGDNGRRVLFSQDGNYLACASANSPYLTVFKKNEEGTFDKLQELTGIGNDCQGVSFSSDGNYITCASANSPYFTVFKKNEEGTFDKLQELTNTGNAGYGVSFSSDGNYIACASYSSSPYFTVFNTESTTVYVEFDTPPVANAVIEYHCTVPYIPKTEDYVLDISFELLFAEGV